MLERGIPLDSESLALAVYDKDVGVATAAIRIAREISPSSSLTNALLSVANEADATRAIAAIDSLRALGDKRWVPSALGRLHSEPVPLHRLQIAAHLARAGRGDGWPVVREMLGSDRYTARDAVAVVALFDGLPSQTGERVEVLGDLLVLQDSVDADVRPYLDLEIEKMRRQKR